ncbi:MAG: hypothetical protein R8K49_03265 [Mariprofundaceae bacterium]
MDMQDAQGPEPMAQEKSKDTAGKFNERWERLGHIQADLTEKFINEVLGQLSSEEHDEFMPHIEEILGWQKKIHDNFSEVSSKHLSAYAQHLKNTAMLAIKLCKKYEIYNDINSVNYTDNSQILSLNNEEFYFFG